MTVLLTWLGGAHAGLSDRHERTGYSVTGAVVALFAITAGVIVALAAGAADWHLAAVVVAALLSTLLVGAISRALATAATPEREEDQRGGSVYATPAGAQFAARIAVAALVGIVVAELAGTVLFGGTVDRLLDEKAGRGVESAPAVVTARDALEQARGERTALDQQMTKAQNDIDAALITARCEFNPQPECPRTRITGVPGRGPEERTANQLLEDARTRLTTAQGKVEALDARVTDRDALLGSARAGAYTGGDRGLGARWVAMNDHTTAHAGALALRVALDLLFVLLALLPLLLRWWRGETSFDRDVAARTVADRVDQAAGTAIAVKQAEVRVEAEALRAEQQLTAAKLAAHADTAIDRERQRTRIIAAIGNFEIGITEPAQQRAIDEFDRAAQRELPAARGELPAASPAGNDMPQEGTVNHTPNLPDRYAPGRVAPVGAGGALAPAAQAPAPVAPVAAQAAPANKGGGLELPIIGTVPFTDTAARWIRPLVPSFVANAIDTATHPLRTVRQAFEEAEEITFTLRRTRKVTVDSEDSAAQQARQQMYGAPPQYGYQLPAGSPQHVYAQRVAADVLHPYPQYQQHYAASPGYPALGPGPVVEPGYPLPPADRQGALPAQHRPELDHRHTPELGGRDQRELPPGTGS
ncbi:DUF4407 domain-containing protein [Nocardia sp. NPDC057668]|uniref:DUF4407 domain-containing protein n=1 Tax=Nocardia sp. NPDC057668 TaxID=3346202 RepID=UPI00366BF04F